MFDWNLRTEDFECSLGDENSDGLYYLLCTAGEANADCTLPTGGSG